MRPTLARLARALEPGQPTGLTGLLSHPAPRSALIFLYSSTLKKLQKVPEHSPYRQATEALTKKRLAIVEESKPAGYDAWLERVQQAIAAHRQQYPLPEGETEAGEEWDGRQFVFAQMISPDTVTPEDLESEYEAATGTDAAQEGIRSQEERDIDLRSLTEANIETAHAKLRVEPEPLLTREQVGEIENKIGAGLIEEVIQVAEGEHKLVDVMIENKVWEDLCEQPPEGQWTYFERNTHTSTQKP